MNTTTLTAPAQAPASSHLTAARERGPHAPTPGGRAAEAVRPTTLTMAAALNAGLRRAMDHDDKVLLMGEDIGALGGVFRVTDGLQRDFGEQRVVDTPLSEAGIVGTATGLAMAGYRPVCEIQFDGFIFPAFNQIVTQLAKMRSRTSGATSLPVVVRVPFGGGIGAVEHHSESPEALFSHVPGLRVVSPASPQDAYWMIQQAITSDDPVMVFEPKRRYWDRGPVELAGRDRGRVRALDEAPPLHSARVVAAGSDVTVLAYGPTVRVALDAAVTARAEGTSVEVVDLRSMSPLDLPTIEASVRRTGRCVVVHEAPTFLGLGAELAARITESCFHHLEAPVLRVGGFAVPYPVARVEEHYLPDADRVLDAVDRALAY